MDMCPFILKDFLLEQLEEENQPTNPSSPRKWRENGYDDLHDNYSSQFLRRQPGLRNGPGQTANAVTACQQFSWCKATQRGKTARDTAKETFHRPGTDTELFRFS